ncbi:MULTISPECIES: HlyD family type I secretion periplasmic adaptor subunit [Sinorhizobium]|uniref:Membrane fusion protein (MFP) family protein n=1 Tax=Rhizobium fredii TaxID=380 RepID=A0A2L0HG15_RHIFR|nr:MULTISPECIES: HlyD family type I secretion periplasmic adaptor subunit [Sinorhizobium]ASY60251.1 protein secretion protein, HlyD family [Sinorhizobium sp. CCBAU 05631]AUX80441.1 HlyD family secretion protein [Sinorhizobium fredii]PDT52754.1 HlyD family type I secretion periplasmic adaptor subunit [Sinorhizobium sp. NG07B]POH28926.1 hemolysin secretion protein D [Sinorhizobium americanum]
MSGSTQRAPNARRSLSRHMIGVSVLALALVAGVGGWAATTELSSAIVAGGVVVVDDNVKKVQHLTGGIVGELKVKEGDRVEAGQVLIRLDGTTVRANLAIVESTLAQLYARRARLLAERIGAESFEIDKDLANFVSSAAAAKLVDGEQKLFASRRTALLGMKGQLQSRKAQLADEIDGLTVQLKAIEDALTLIAEELTGVDSLYGRGLVPMQRVTTLKRQRAELEGDRGRYIASRAQARGKSSEIDLQVLQLDEDRRTEISKELTDVEAKIAEYEERRTAATDQLRRLDITAPLPGRVYQLAVHTVNGVVNPGETLMLVVPEADELTVEARVATHDIDQIRVGQPVEIRFSAFNQRTTPEVEAEVVTVAPDMVSDERTGATYYPLRIRPKPESLAKLKGLSLYPGMPAEVFIKIADRTVISYLAKPLTDQMRHAFRED